ncbi:MAG: hypothetical protein LBN40_05715 [Oscillospiraceae bacterium]|jgi:hypothetical protein|nr:hypothetical protein [Oscillospiraceae bacterium]
MLSSVSFYRDGGYDDGGLNSAALESVLYRAERKIDGITGGLCRNHENLRAIQIIGLKQAICLEAERGITKMSGGAAASSVGGTVKIGDFSYETGGVGVGGGGVYQIDEEPLLVLRYHGLIGTGVRAR